MKWRVFSVVGEALNFGVRRMEMIARIAWLPLALLLVIDMASIFGYLSIANGRIITFGDLAEGASYGNVRVAAGGAAAAGLARGSLAIWTILLSHLAITWILIASFMAPLIRYAGLGEKPARGVLRIPFGADQARFIAASLLGLVLGAIVVYLPVAAAAFYIIGAIQTAASTPYASFPNPDSLHTVEILVGPDALDARGALSLYRYGYWGAGAAILSFLLFSVLLFHFRRRITIARILALLIGLAAYLAAFVLAASRFGDQGLTLENVLVALFYAAALALVLYASLRLFPYAGLAVCRRSLAPAGTLGLTRGGGLFRLLATFSLLGLILYAMWFLLVFICGGAALFAFETIAAAAGSMTRFAHDGEQAAWVAPLFRAIWASIGILFQLIWAFFTYGVYAALLGRLYRESAGAH